MDSKEILLRYVRRARQGLLSNADGLSERELRLPRTPTGTNLLGLIKHCLMVEAGYLVECMGRDTGLLLPEVDEADPHGDLYATPEESAADLIALYRRLGDVVEATVADLPLDAPAHVPWWGEAADTTLERLLVHVIHEVGRHAGHADILREGIDGVAGLDEPGANIEVPADGWPRHVARLTAIAEGFPAQG